MYDVLERLHKTRAWSVRRVSRVRLSVTSLKFRFFENPPSPRTAADDTVGCPKRNVDTRQPVVSDIDGGFRITVGLDRILKFGHLGQRDNFALH